MDRHRQTGKQEVAVQRTLGGHLRWTDIDRQVIRDGRRPADSWEVHLRWTDIDTTGHQEAAVHMTLGGHQRWTETESSETAAVQRDSWELHLKTEDRHPVRQAHYKKAAVQRTKKEDT